MTSPTVAVIGAGPAGSAAALLLARAGVSVRLIDRQSPRRRRAAEVLSPSAKAVLSRLGLWDRRPAGAVTPCPAIASAWDAPEPLFRSFITNPYGCAWHVDRERFDAWLADEAERAGAARVHGIVTATRRRDRGWAIDIHGPDEIGCLEADAVIVATGRSRAAIGAPARRADSLCVIGGWTTAAPQCGDELLIEAVAGGWWYTVPSTDNRVFAGWTTDLSLLRGKSHAEAIQAALADAPFTRMRLVDAPAPQCLDASMSWIDPAAGDGWIAIGDAAFARDPISGDGLAHALESAWEGTRTVLAILRNESSWNAAAIGHLAAVDAYRRKRRELYTAASRRWPTDTFWAARGRASSAPTVSSLSAHAP